MLIRNRYAVAVPLIVLLSVMAMIYGCSPSDQLGGAELNNALPDTRITGTPPVLRETDFIVSFSWTGLDPDGEIVGYHWKIANNGIDGLGVLDTLTLDPATGDTLNPWFYTEATDTTFIVLARELGFEGDSWLPENEQRFYEHHSLFIRAEDNDGGLDPTPAHVTFTATTLAPSITLTSPSTWAGQEYSVSSPTTVSLQWTGVDPDFELGVPIRVRYLNKRAIDPDGNYVTTSYGFYQNVDFLVDFNDSLWSDWVRYGDDPEDRIYTKSDIQITDDEGERISYLFALQAQDTAGAVSQDRIYNRTVYNFKVSEGQSPSLNVRERYLGDRDYSGVNGVARFDIAKNQPLEFSWYASAEHYGGEVIAYRYGWDVEDPNNEEDQNWAVSWGNTPLHKRAPINSFSNSTHSLIVQAIDNSGLITRATYYVAVVPVPDPDAQFPLLLIDDVVDHNTNAWPTPGGASQYEDIRRDEFWDEVLAGQGGVSGYEPAIHSIDVESNSLFGYRDAVNYRVLLWTTCYGSRYVTDMFAGTSQYVWLAAYQQSVGNLFMAGASSMYNFSKEPGDTRSWAMPIIYDTSDETVTCENVRLIGYGTREDEDTGEFIRIGSELYPFRTNGMSVIDLLSPSFIYECYYSGDRKSSCVGTRAITIDQDFKDNYVDFGAFPDTIEVSHDIIWWDFDPDHNYGEEIPSVNKPYLLGASDEFYDINVTTRPTPWSPQLMPDGRLAVEPMWRLYTRYDWVMNQHIESGNFAYPTFAPSDTCGSLAFEFGTAYAGGAHEYTTLNQVPLGVFIWQTTESKPGGKPDVLWGFDPYAFDRDPIKQAIRWVLLDHFELDSN
ncbi:hypothetical protein HOD41_03125 [bacterium]|nr:hypothetical protein [bacterium]